MSPLVNQERHASLSLMIRPWLLLLLCAILGAEDRRQSPWIISYLGLPLPSPYASARLTLSSSPNDGSHNHGLELRIHAVAVLDVPKVLYSPAPDLALRCRVFLADGKFKQTGTMGAWMTMNMIADPIPNKLGGGLLDYRKPGPLHQGCQASVTISYAGNDLRYGYIEIVVGDAHYWLDVPKGCFRNPSDPLCTATGDSSYLVLPDAFAAGDKLVPWSVATFKPSPVILPDRSYVSLSFTQSMFRERGLARVALSLPSQPNQQRNLFSIEDPSSLSIGLFNQGNAQVFPVGRFLPPDPYSVRKDTFDLTWVWCEGAGFCDVQYTYRNQTCTAVVPNGFVFPKSGHVDNLSHAQLVAWSDPDPGDESGW